MLIDRGRVVIKRLDKLSQGGGGVEMYRDQVAYDEMLRAG